MLLSELFLIESAAGHGIEGLPDDVKIADSQLRAMIASGRYRFRVVKSTPNRYYDAEDYTVAFEPEITDRAVPYQRRRARASAKGWHDPNMTDLRHEDEDDEWIARTYAIPKSDHSDEIDPLGEGIIYRGMSDEEYQSFRRTGLIQSRGDYNIGDAQKGLTYWTTEVDTAVSYANGFAPIQYKPTFARPAYVVAAHAPDPADTRHVRGVGSHEVGVTRAITANEVVAIWEGTVIASEGDEFDLKYQPDGTHAVSGNLSPSPRVIWHRIA